MKRAGLSDASGRSLHITPHQLRHTYGTSLINDGMSLQVLMALLGRVTPEMTLRYAHLASDTVRRAYDEAMDRARSRHLPVLVAGPAGSFVPDRVAWLEAEMLKTRVTSQFRWKIGEGRRFLVVMLGGGCNGLAEMAAWVSGGGWVEQLAA